MPQEVRKPIALTPPPGGVAAAESMHDPAFAMPRERHPFYELYYIYRGAARYHEQNQREALTLPAGSLWLIPKNRWHRLEDIEPTTLLLLALSREYVEHPDCRELWSALRARKHAPLIPDTFERETIEASFRRMLAEQSGRRPGAALMLKAEANRILVLLSRQPDAPRHNAAEVRVRGVIRLLEETFYEPWEVDAAARKAHLSRRRFTQIFRSLTGESFLMRRNELRLQHAARLLHEGRQTIAGAAFSSGFGDLAHFYRLFRRRFGKSPGAWARE
ncbi:helix-turn-helix transcriptional regulator [Candidatus Sumerlaeota bacterium]|nr:helix-turn-helix transcriptional regulator [Candidatus Sumerlaeota bacterium]